MRFQFMIVLAAMTLSAPAFADDSTVGDAAKGEKGFTKCKACHMIQDADGNKIYKGGKTGPNLFNVVGRKVASVEGFKYGKGLLSVAEANPDLVWDEANLLAYVEDAQAWIDANGGEGKTRMTYKMKKDQPDMVAYLKSVSPDAPEETE